MRLAAKKAEAQASKEKQSDNEEAEEQRLKEIEREFFNLISQVDETTPAASGSAEDS